MYGITDNAVTDSVIIVHRNDRIYGVYTEPQLAINRMRLEEKNRGLDGCMDTRVYITEKEIDNQ